MLLNSLRRIGSLFLTLAVFLAGPVLMLVVCCAVCLLVMVTQFWFVVPLLLPFVLPFMAGWTWLKSEGILKSSSAHLDISH